MLRGVFSQITAAAHSPHVPNVLLFVASLILLWLLIRQGTSVHHVMVHMEVSVPVRELEQLVQQQQEELDYLAHHPKVVLRCLDDEPRRWYPKQASDDLTDINMATNDGCGDLKKLDVVMIVHTSANHFDRRELFREIYSNENATSPYKVKVAFLIGHVHDAKLQIDLEIENRRFGDTIVGNFIDSYENLTLKAVMGYRWLSETCDSLPMLVKMDDDVLVDIPKFITSYREKINPDGLKRRIFCNVWENAKVARTGKWKIEKGLFSNTTYPFPYCSGFFVLVTPDLVKSMYEVGKDIDFFWVDDVFVYGMVPAAIKNVTFVNIGDTVDYIARYRHSYKRCLNKNGWKCKTFGVLTSGIENFKELHAQTKKLYMSNSSLLTNASEAVPAVSSKNPGEKLGKKADPIKAQ